MIQTSARALGLQARGLDVSEPGARTDLDDSMIGNEMLISMIGRWMIGNGFDDAQCSHTLDALREVGGYDF